MVDIPSGQQQQTRGYIDSLLAFTEDMGLWEQAIPGCLAVDLSAIQCIGILDITAELFLTLLLGLVLFLKILIHVLN